VVFALENEMVLLLADPGNFKYIFYTMELLPGANVIYPLDFLLPLPYKKSVISC
jgi:hypothetical protein